jgi:hypothetical protein
VEPWGPGLTMKIQLDFEELAFASSTESSQLHLSMKISRCLHNRPRLVHENELLLKKLLIASKNPYLMRYRWSIDTFKSFGKRVIKCSCMILPIFNIVF